MTTYLLDTNTVSYFLRDHSPALSSKLMATKPEALAVSVITAGELRFGLKKLSPSQRATALSHRLDQLLETLTVLPMPPETSEHYAATRAHLEAKGTPIGGNDLWIAAHALASDMTVITNNLREFERVPGLKVEDWS
ncbi:type II toxin-antitoxin system VapC family toxin [Hydrogenophaga aromaticivorans]|uniref:type II toxin-antitoxin system VapC family toxin n=1 Tax=Hydrogenophaga aromaticivorans TaxID=2610898 RepID=UPI001B371FF3|nr:type II toxin-antitoxin system VapC family toxin [Hydrogenophaga aromaticivorans]MBQ0921470.1 type II toxin-antitoxin system VapC family toxin [Hydrogenophaga aromaticivorans]